VGSRELSTPTRLGACAIAAMLSASLAYLGTARVETVTATYPTPNLRLPYSSGESWKFQGPHSWDAQPGIWNSIDLVPPSNVENVWAIRAAGGGSFTGGTAQVHLDGCGAGGGYVRLDHGNHWYTTYYHLASVAVTDLQLVGDGAFIGRAGMPKSSNCFGAEGSGVHDHFSIWLDGTGSCPTFRIIGTPRHPDLNCSLAWNNYGNHPLLLGNWIVSTPNYPPSQYVGCMTRITDGVQFCQTNTSGAGGPIPQDNGRSDFPALKGEACPNMPSATTEIGNSPFSFVVSPTVVDLHLQQVVIHNGNPSSWCFQVWAHVYDGSNITNVNFNVRLTCGGGVGTRTYSWSTGLAAPGDFYVSTGPVTNCPGSTAVDNAAGATGTSFTVYNTPLQYPDTYLHYP